MVNYLLFLLGCILSGDQFDDCISKYTQQDSSLPGSGCIPRKYEYDSTVCVCNASYCDNIEHVPDPPNDKYLHYTSSRSGERMSLSIESFILFGPTIFKVMDSEIHMCKIKPYERYQTMLGFGGAITDAVGINLLTLTEPTQDNLLRQYFGDGGINYTFVRTPIGGTDFSTRYYSLDDVVNDTTLSHFSLTEEDLLYKIPFIKKAINMSIQEVKLFTTSWSSPMWMKQPRRAMIGRNSLQKRYYQLYADYHIKFLGAYKEHGLNFWGITPQNEPNDGAAFYLGFNCLGWSAEEQRDWLADYLGPTLHKNGYEDLIMMILDDQRLFLPWWANVMINEKTRNYVSGIAVHSYTDTLPVAPASLLSDTHRNFPELFILNTEGCNMHFVGAAAAPLGLWDHAESYGASIIEDINNWSTGWVDWNLALDLMGGPNWVNNTVDAPIIVNATADEFYKQPIFYALAHFSKFVPPGSRRIQIDCGKSEKIMNNAFITPDNNIVIVIMNKHDTEQHISIISGLRGNIVLILPPHSFHTIVYKNSLF